jgi:hypothetical protein
MKKFGVEPLGNEFAAMILARLHNADIAVG